jgi:hypothetical protein
MQYSWFGLPLQFVDMRQQHLGTPCDVGVGLSEESHNDGSLGDLNQTTW